MRLSKEAQAAIEKALKDGTATATRADPGAHIRTGEVRGLVPVFASEAEFQAEVIIAAKMRGWKVAHFRPVRIQRRNGSTYYETPVQADGKGFPDLILVRDRVLVAELKVPGNKPSPEQDDWLERFMLAGAGCYLWYPADWERILETLK